MTSKADHIPYATICQGPASDRKQFDGNVSVVISEEKGTWQDTARKRDCIYLITRLSFSATFMVLSSNLSWAQSFLITFLFRASSSLDSLGKIIFLSFHRWGQPLSGLQ